jgi:hypothetical protein
MGSDHDFVAKNAGFFTVVRKLLAKNAGFSLSGRPERAKSAVARPFLGGTSRAERRQDGPPGRRGGADHTMQLDLHRVDI